MPDLASDTEDADFHSTCCWVETYLHLVEMLKYKTFESLKQIRNQKLAQRMQGQGQGIAFGYENFTPDL